MMILITAAQILSGSVILADAQLIAHSGRGLVTTYVRLARYD